jgi:hypothetical protein
LPLLGHLPDHDRIIVLSLEAGRREVGSSGAQQLAIKLIAFQVVSAAGIEPATS